MNDPKPLQIEYLRAWQFIEGLESRGVQFKHDKDGIRVEGPEAVLDDKVMEDALSVMSIIEEWVEHSAAR
jgi:hypothetical protein